MCTGRWSELSAEHEIRCTGNVIFWFITMSKASGVAESLWPHYGVFIGKSVGGEKPQ
jgi:hypothetical protein